MSSASVDKEKLNLYKNDGVWYVYVAGPKDGMGQHYYDTNIKLDHKIGKAIELYTAALKQELKQSLEAQMPKDLNPDLDRNYRIGFNEANKLNREAINKVFQVEGDEK